MRAFHKFSANSPATLTEINRPTPGPGELLIRIEACGLNFADLLMDKGTYQDTPQLPFTLGMEVAGFVEAHGEGIAEPAIGSRVAVFGGHGGLAEYGCFPASRAVVLPDVMSAAEAAAFQIAYGTSHVALGYRARLQPGENLVVLGAAGGVGLTAVEIGAIMGANVIAVARGPDKLAAAKSAGAHHLIDAAGGDDLRNALKALGGVDVLYDPVGGEQFTAAFRAANPEARLLTIGFASGDVPQIKANHLLVKNLTVEGFYWGAYLDFKPQVVTDSLNTLMHWYTQGRIKPHISHELPLEQAGEGLNLLKQRKSTGKVVIRPA